MLFAGVECLSDLNALGGKSVAVTGAGGYIGAVLCDALLEIGANVLRVSRGELPPLVGMDSLRADLRKAEPWLAIVERTEIIFHLAGNTSLYAAAKHPMDSLLSTVLPINHLVTACRETGRAPRVVFASTATVYGLTKNLPVAESFRAEPVTVYDLHKLFAEQQLEMASSQGFLDGVSLRLANVYGPSSSTSSAEDRGILNKITKMALQGGDLRLYGDGNYMRDYVYVDDVVQAFLLAGIADSANVSGRAFNVAGGAGFTVGQAFQIVADKVNAQRGSKVQLHQAPWPEGADSIELRNFIADIGALRTASGWFPCIGLEQGIDLLIAGFSRTKAQ